MKKLLAGIALTLGVFYIHAQDIIILKNGDEIKSKVTEIDDLNIRYKKFDNLSGPTYAVLKTNVFMVRYENGSKEVYGATKTQVPPMQNATVRPNIDAQRKYRKQIAGGAVMTGIGASSLAAGLTLTAIGFIGYEEYYTNYDDPALWIPGLILLQPGIVLSIVGPIQLSRGARHRREFMANSAYISFTPIKGNYVNHSVSFSNQQKLFSVSLHF